MYFFFAVTFNDISIAMGSAELNNVHANGRARKNTVRYLELGRSWRKSRIKEKITTLFFGLNRYFVRKKK